MTKTGAEPPRAAGDAEPIALCRYEELARHENWKRAQASLQAGQQGQSGATGDAAGAAAGAADRLSSDDG